MADNTVVTIGGSRFRFGTAVILGVLFHLGTVIFTGGVIWAKLEARISKLEDAALKQEFIRDKDRALFERLAEKIETLSGQLARMEGRLEGGSRR